MKPARPTRASPRVFRVVRPGGTHAEPNTDASPTQPAAGCRQSVDGNCNGIYDRLSPEGQDCSEADRTGVDFSPTTCFYTMEARPIRRVPTPTDGRVGSTDGRNARPGTGLTPRGCAGDTTSNSLRGSEEPPVPEFCGPGVPYINSRPYGLLNRNLEITGNLGGIQANCPVTRQQGLRMNQYWAIRFKPDALTAGGMTISMDARGGPRSALISISECPGDFGPAIVTDFNIGRAPTSGGTRGKKSCVSVHSVESTVRIATNDLPGIENQAFSTCILEPGKTYYFNVIHASPENITEQPMGFPGSPDRAYACASYPDGKCGLTMQSSFVTGRILPD